MSAGSRLLRTGSHETCTFDYERRIQGSRFATPRIQIERSGIGQDHKGSLSAASGAVCLRVVQLAAHDLERPLTTKFNPAGLLPFTRARFVEYNRHACRVASYRPYCSLRWPRKGQGCAISAGWNRGLDQPQIFAHLRFQGNQFDRPHASAGGVLSREAARCSCRLAPRRQDHLGIFRKRRHAACGGAPARWNRDEVN